MNNQYIGSDVTLEILDDGDIEQCRDLCGELMAYQKSKAKLIPEAFNHMNFDTRMKKSYNEALRRQVIVAKHNSIPIGYIFSTVDEMNAKNNSIPVWAPVSEGETVQGFYPDWLKPQKIGSVSNLFFRPEYRGIGLGKRLFTMAMEWLESFDDIYLIFIYVSNGNDTALRFYLNQGFTFSHDVFGGFIQAVYKARSIRFPQED
ncbi:acetyltransferase [Dehalobacter sp. UNSWDHB]|jgi:Acetyltransferases|uniref:GNAT family N-acetyltransferase n=1 Tax=Dehalobacter TaxID=56112 RepID=UPI00028ACF59|nr:MULTISPECIES: GNAT family N-acetyltransferase [unclassified Dehalobacter]AFV02261.1 acetyltransferase [Dehalobacter sp. DCA]AFV05304.1 acetyltransferase [Dehalobacter sp. CF]EQB22099.1 acetyltransferase [Dehalobacter sp. UNSWDHB]